MSKIVRKTMLGSLEVEHIEPETAEQRLDQRLKLIEDAIGELITDDVLTAQQRAIRLNEIAADVRDLRARRAPLTVDDVRSLNLDPVDVAIIAAERGVLTLDSLRGLSLTPSVASLIAKRAGIKVDGRPRDHDLDLAVAFVMAARARGDERSIARVLGDGPFKPREVERLANGARTRLKRSRR